MTFYSYENLPLGLEIPFGPKLVRKAEIIKFAQEFDPAPFHLDEEAALKSPLKGLCASGFHTCAMIMRMICDAYLLNSTSQGGPGVETCEWIRPVRPGNILTGKSTVISTRHSKSRPENAIIRLRHSAQNQNDEPVIAMITVNIFRVSAPEKTP